MQSKTLGQGQPCWVLVTHSWLPGWDSHSSFCVLLLLEAASETPSLPAQSVVDTGTDSWECLVINAPMDQCGNH